MPWNREDVSYSGDFSEQEIKEVFRCADRVWSCYGACPEKYLTLILFEPEMDLETIETQFLLGRAMHKLGGNYNVLQLGTSSMKKGESKLDTLRVMMGNSEIVAIRDKSNPVYDYIEMAKKPATGVVKVPIINAGDIKENPIYVIADSYRDLCRRERRDLFNNIQQYRVSIAMVLIYTLLGGGRTTFNTQTRMLP